MKNREPGIDLLRCFALLCVVGVHSCLYNNFYSIPQKGLVMWAADSFRWMFYCCNILFMMLTGYLKSGKQYSKGYYRSLIGILLSYVLCCAVSFPIRHFWLNDQGSLYDWFTLLVTFGNYGWYVEMYIGLFLLSPFLNIILDKLNTPRQFCWLAGTMVFLTAVPSVIPTINFFPDYWTGLYPLTMYVLGAGVRKFRPQIPSWVAGLAAAAVLMLMGFFSIASTDQGFSSGFSQGYGGFWVTLACVFLFLSMYRLQLPTVLHKPLAWMSTGVFEGFLLSRLFDVWVYATAPGFFRQPENYWLGFLCLTLPIYIFSLLLGKMVHFVSTKLMGLIFPKKPAPV